MNYLKLKEGTKDRCLQALDHLKFDHNFECLMENMFEETLEAAKKNVVELPVNDQEFQPLQGICRVMQEFINLSRDAHEKRGRQ